MAIHKEQELFQTQSWRTNVNMGLSEVCTIIFVNCWLMCVMMGSAILVADVVKEVCIGTHPWQCWLASFLYVVDLEMLRTCKSVPDWDRN